MEKMTWSDARQACTKVSPFAQLASIKDMWEMSSLAEFLLGLGFRKQSKIDLLSKQMR